MQIVFWPDAVFRKLSECLVRRKSKNDPRKTVLQSLQIDVALAERRIIDETGVTTHPLKNDEMVVFPPENTGRCKFPQFFCIHLVSVTDKPASSGCPNDIARTAPIPGYIGLHPKLFERYILPVILQDHRKAGSAAFRSFDLQNGPCSGDKRLSGHVRAPAAVHCPSRRSAGGAGSS